MQFMTVDEIARHALADHERGEEISPGVVVERRTILRFGIAAAGLAASGLGLAGCASGAKDSGNLASTRGTRPTRAASADEFVAAVMPQARALIAAPGARRRGVPGRGDRAARPGGAAAGVADVPGGQGVGDGQHRLLPAHRADADQDGPRVRDPSARPPALQRRAARHPGRRPVPQLRHRAAGREAARHRRGRGARQGRGLPDPPERGHGAATPPALHAHPRSRQHPSRRSRRRRGHAG
jgi:hypothetical protein